MKKSNKKIKNPIVIALYTLSIIIGIYALVTMYNSYSYISLLVSQGLVISEELLNVICYFVENTVPYIFYAVATWAIGYIISKLNYILSSVKVENNEYEAIEEIIIEESNEPMSMDEIETVEEDVTTIDEDNNI